MKTKLILLCTAICGLACAVEYVTACRALYNSEVESAAMPLDAWTNSVSWVSSASPVFNVGATNAAWLCYAKNCAGNLFQPVLASQPLTTNKAGRVCFYSDGGDYLEGTNAVALTSYTLFCRVFLDATNAAGAVLIGRGVPAYSPGNAFLLMNDGRLSVRHINAASGYQDSSTGAPGTGFVTTGAWHSVCATYDSVSSNVVFYFNGVERASLTNSIMPNYSSNLALMVNNRPGTYGQYFAGYMSSPMAFNRALTSNEVWRLSQ